MYLLRKVIYSLFSSSYVMLALLLVFITAMASATFIERDYGIVVAWNQIYDTLWFESIMFALSGCFIANIIKYQLIHKKKWALLLFHLAFITILVGAAVTRYTSLSGVLRVREGEKSSTVISTKNYFQINYQPKACLKQKGCVKRKKTALSFHDEQHFSGELEYKKKSLFIHISQYISNAEIRLKKNPEHGKPSVEIIVNEGIKKTNLILQESQQKSIETEKQIIEFGTSNTMPKENVTIFIFEDNGQLWMQTKEDLEHFKLKMNRPISIKKNKMYPVQIKTLYQGQNYSFMFLNYFPKGEKVIITKDQKSSNTSQNTQDVLVVNLTWNGEKADAMLTYKEGFLPAFETIRLGKHVIDIGYGSLAIPMPFALYLDDFRLTRYPGSSSPSAYESDITIIDEEKSIPYMIYMNNVLDWKGYRFYQASYDSDEQGTVLSVNKDWWGTHITYLGYAMLVIGMFFTLFAKKSRFQGVRMKLKALAKQNYAILIFAFLSYTLLWHEVGKTKTVFRPTYIAQEKPPQASNGPLVYVDPILADKWGQILVQDINGRIKPMNTLALEIIRKLSGKRTLPIPTINAENQEKTLLNANQMMLSMHVFPNQWKKIDLIKWNKKNLTRKLFLHYSLQEMFQ